MFERKNFAKSFHVSRFRHDGLQHAMHVPCTVCNTTESDATTKFIVVHVRSGLPPRSRVARSGVCANNGYNDTTCVAGCGTWHGKARMANIHVQLTASSSKFCRTPVQSGHSFWTFPSTLVLELLLLSRSFSLPWGMSENKSKTAEGDDISRPQSGAAGVTFPHERSSRSDVWKFFNRSKAANGKSFATCTLCNKTLAYNGGTTSNLHAHLERIHPSNVPHAGREQKPNAAQLTVTQFVKDRGPCAAARPITSDRIAELNQRLARWCWLDNRPINIVQDKGLRDIMAYVERNYTVPSETHVTSLVKKQYVDAFTALKSML